MNLEVAYMKWYIIYNSPKYPKNTTLLEFNLKILLLIWISFLKS
jgi:hypothetical protein